MSAAPYSVSAAPYNVSAAPYDESAAPYGVCPHCTVFWPYKTLMGPPGGLRDPWGGVLHMKNFYGLKLLKNHFYTKKNADPPNLNMIIDNLDFMKTTVNILRPIYHALNKT